MLILIAVLIQLKPVQTKVTQQILNAISESIMYDISIDHVSVSWLDRATFNNILILDAKDDTLLYAGSLTVDYALVDIFRQDFLNVEEISSDNVILNLVKYDTLSELNLVTFINSLKSTDKKENKPLSIGEIDFSNLHLSYFDHTKDTITEKFDFAHFTMDFSDFILGDLLVTNDIFAVEVIGLIGSDPNKNLEIENFNSRILLTNQMLSVTDLSFDTPTSHLADSIKLHYDGLENLAYFVDSVSFGIYMSESIISQQDLSALTGINSIKSDISFDGIIRGTVGDFDMENAVIGFGDESYIEGGVSCFGLPDVDQTFLLADLTDAHFVPEDLRPYVGEILENVPQLGRVDFTGSFAGFLRDFVARGDFYTEKGIVRADINIKIPEEIENISYKGNLELKHVDMGTFLQNQELIQEVNLKARIDGNGITPEKAHLSLNATATQSSIKGYTYDSLTATGSFASNFFEGNFSVFDPNAQIQCDATIDFNGLKEVLNFKLKIDTLAASEVNLTEHELGIHGSIKVDIIDLDLDHFTGIVEFDSGLFALNGHYVELDSMRFKASFSEDVRFFDFSIPGLDAKLKGRFRPSDVLLDVPIIFKDYMSKINLRFDSIRFPGSGESYKMELNVNVKDIDAYLDSLDIPVKIAQNTYVEMVYRQGKDANFSFYAQSEFIEYNGSEFYFPVFEINSFKELDGSGILTNFIMESERQIISGIPETKNLLIEGIWFDDRMDLTTSIIQEATQSNVKLSVGSHLARDSIALKMLPSDIVIFGEKWTFNPSNLITVYEDKIRISNLEIYEEVGSISIEGIISDTMETQIGLSAEEVNLNKASLISELKVQGFLNGTFNVSRNNNGEDFQFDGVFQANNFHLNDLFIGQINGSSTWNPFENSVYSKLDISGEVFHEISIEGNYYPLRNQDQLDFDLNFDHAKLSAAQSFLGENFSNLKGRADGQLKITGNRSNPVVVGDCIISDGGVTVNYLNTSYLFDGKVIFQPKLLSVSDFTVLDRKGSMASVNGTIHHSSFRDMTIYLGIDADNFEFLNTTPVDNRLYYGTAHGTGFINVTGSLNDLLIQANIKTDKDTRFFIPVSGNREVSGEDYILFTDFGGYAKHLSVNESFDLTGLTLDFDIEVTPDAYCELIFDIKSGDIIRGRGRGNLKLTLDTDGEFHMFGPLEIEEGGYNFTVKGILNKEFVIVPGSRITWFGDPYDAVLELEATYLQRVSLEELKNPEERDQAQLTIKEPINVILHLNGGMLTPQIDFDIQLAEGIEDENIESQLTQIVTEEQELKRQVISLLLLKRFSPKQSFLFGRGGDLFSLSELLSSQAGYLLSQLDENLEIEIDLAALDQNAFQTFQLRLTYLRLTYTFLRGRLKVTRGGGFGNEEVDQSLLNDIVGDLSVEYSLTQDGRLRVKVFKTTNQRLSQQNHEAGISLRVVHSFNDFRELLSTWRKEAIRRQEDEKEIDPNEKDGVQLSIKTIPY